MIVKKKCKDCKKVTTLIKGFCEHCKPSLHTTARARNIYTSGVLLGTYPEMDLPL